MSEPSFLAHFNLIALLYLIFFLASVALGALVFSKNAGSSISRVFGLLAAAFGVLHFGEMMFSWSPYPADAFEFTKIKSIGFAFWWPLSMHLFILMSRRKLNPGWRIFLGILYTYCAVFVASFFLGISHAESYERHGLVWVDKPYWSPVSLPFLVMMPLCLGINLTILFRMYFRGRREGQTLLAQQARILLISGIPFAGLGMSFNVVLPMLGVVLPSLGHLFIGFWILVVGWAILKYRFLVPTLEFAAKQVFTIAGEMIVLTDLQGRISEFNQAFLDRLGRPLKPAERLQDLITPEAPWDDILHQETLGPVVGHLAGSQGQRIHLRLRRSFLFDGEVKIALVFVLADITDLKNLNDHLEQKVQDRTRDLALAHAESQRRLSITEVYTRPSVVQIIRQGQDPRQFMPQSRRLAVLFSDIRDFTGLAEHQSPLETVKILNTYFDRMNQCILARGGEIDKLIGDCIMALFPTADQALAAALDMRAQLTVLNQDQPPHQQIAQGIGINYGEVILGNIGSKDKMDYTVIGDMVNTTSRLESLTKVYQAALLLSSELKDQLTQAQDLRFLDRIVVKGKRAPVDLWESYAGDSEDLRRAKTQSQDLYRQAFSAYQQGNFPQALAVYQEIKTRFPDPSLEFFIQRCRDLQDRQSRGQLPGWQGIYAFEEK